VAFTLLIFAAIGCTISTGIFRRKAWGCAAMAWLFTCAAIIAAVVRIVMPPRWVMDSNLSLILTLSILAVST
jgi:hypothetical protein